VKNFHRLNYLIVQTPKSKLRRRFKTENKTGLAFLGASYSIFVSVYPKVKCGGENSRGVRDTIQLSLVKNHQGYVWAATGNHATCLDYRPDRLCH